MNKFKSLQLFQFSLEIRSLASTIQVQKSLKTETIVQVKREMEKGRTQWKQLIILDEVIEKYNIIWRWAFIECQYV